MQNQSTLSEKVERIKRMLRRRMDPDLRDEYEECVYLAQRHDPDGLDQILEELEGMG